MSLAKRLQEAAVDRRNAPPPLQTVDLKRSRQRFIDLRAPAPDPQEPEARHNPHSAFGRAGGRYTGLDRRSRAVKPPPGEAAAAATNAVAGHACPRCGHPARIDINDRTRGVLHLSCAECFKMWQTAVINPS